MYPAHDNNPRPNNTSPLGMRASLPAPRTRASSPALSLLGTRASLPAHPAPSPRRGFSLVEVMIATFLLIILSVITVTGMIFHARMAQANLSKQRMADGARRLVEGAQIAILDSTIVRVDTGPAGANTVITFGWPDPNNIGSTIYKQYAYLDTDGNPATIRDNRIVERTVNTPNATTGNIIIANCSPDGTQKIFSQNTNAPYPLYEIHLRIGDRANPPTAVDNGITGKGYQSYRISAELSKG